MFIAVPDQVVVGCVNELIDALVMVVLIMVKLLSRPPEEAVLPGKQPLGTHGSDQSATLADVYPSEPTVVAAAVGMDGRPLTGPECGAPPLKHGVNKLSGELMPMVQTTGMPSEQSDNDTEFDARRVPSVAVPLHPAPSCAPLSPASMLRFRSHASKMQFMLQNWPNMELHSILTRRQNTLEVVPNGENRIACHDMLGIRRRCVPWKFFSSV